MVAIWPIHRIHGFPCCDATWPHRGFSPSSFREFFKVVVVVFVYKIKNYLVSGGGVIIGSFSKVIRFIYFRFFTLRFFFTLQISLILSNS